MNAFSHYRTRLTLICNSEAPPSFDGRYGCVNYFVECLIEEDELHRTGLEIKLESPVRSNLLVSAFVFVFL